MKKHLLTLLSVAMAGFVLASCSKDDATLTVTPQEMTFAATDAPEQIATVETNQADWTVTPDAADWVSFTKKDNTVVVKILSNNPDATDRNAVGTVKAGNKTQTIRVTQTGKTGVSLPDPLTPTAMSGLYNVSSVENETMAGRGYLFSWEGVLFGAGELTDGTEVFMSEEFMMNTQNDLPNIFVFTVDAGGQTLSLPSVALYEVTDDKGTKLTVYMCGVAEHPEKEGYVNVYRNVEKIAKVSADRTYLDFSGVIDEYNKVVSVGLLGFNAQDQPTGWISAQYDDLKLAFQGEAPRSSFNANKYGATLEYTPVKSAPQEVLRSLPVLTDCTVIR